MKASTNCDLCQFQKFCEMDVNPKRLRVEAGILLRDGPKHCPIMEAKRKGL